MRPSPTFIGELDTRKVFDPQRPKLVKLLAPFGFYSPHLDREIIVPAGFETDFGSVPRWPLIYWLFGGVADEAAVIHDWLYTHSGVPRKDADEVFSEAMKACNTAAWRRGPMWLGVRLGGAGRYTAAG